MLYHHISMFRYKFSKVWSNQKACKMALHPRVEAIISVRFHPNSLTPVKMNNSMGSVEIIKVGSYIAISQLRVINIQIEWNNLLFKMISCSGSKVVQTTVWYIEMSICVVVTVTIVEYHCTKDEWIVLPWFPIVFDRVSSESDLKLSCNCRKDKHLI